MFGDGGMSGMRTDAHSNRSIGVRGEHGAPEVTVPGRLSNAYLACPQVLDAELPQDVNEKPSLARLEGVGAGRQFLTSRSVNLR